MFPKKRATCLCTHPYNHHESPMMQRTIHPPSGPSVSARRAATPSDQLLPGFDLTLWQLDGADPG